MDAPPYFEQAEGHAVLRPRGTLILVEVVDLITHAIAFARETGVRRLMVVLTEVTGLKTPGLAARYEFIREWARVSGGLVRVVIVVRAELIDAGNFGVTVAANAGMTGNVLADEKTALEWLLQDT
jgi:hypothetical protein